MSNFVFLIDANKTPMNPIHSTHARKLMEKGKAAVFRMFPFTLIMNRVVDKIITYPLSLRIDPGSKFTGISLVNNRDEVVWGMELQHRGLSIKDALDSRKAVRRGRRARHTRYRQARFLNRKRPKGWLAPSLMHRVLTIETWVKRLIKFSLAKKPELLRKIQSQLKSPLRDAAAVNSTRWALFNRLKLVNLPVSTGSGGQTKFNRSKLDLPKTHWIDSACVGVVDTLKILITKILSVKATGKGTRRLCRMDKFGFPCSKPRTAYEHGWQTGDIATGMGVTGRIVVQSATRLEIRVSGKRVGGKLDQFKCLHKKDGYSYG